jgi:hypothetical protein
MLVTRLAPGIALCFSPTLLKARSLELAGGVARELVQEPDRYRHFEAGQLIPTVVDEVGLCY